jgi:hypothetical protein
MPQCKDIFTSLDLTIFRSQWKSLTLVFKALDQHGVTISEFGTLKSVNMWRVFLNNVNPYVGVNFDVDIFYDNFAFY